MKNRRLGAGGILREEVAKKRPSTSQNVFDKSVDLTSDVVIWVDVGMGGGMAVIGGMGCVGRFVRLVGSVRLIGLVVFVGLLSLTGFGCLVGCSATIGFTLITTLGGVPEINFILSDSKFAFIVRWFVAGLSRFGFSRVQRLGLFDGASVPFHVGNVRRVSLASFFVGLAFGFKGFGCLSHDKFFKPAFSDWHERSN